MKNQNENKAISLEVAEGLKVTVMPDPNHEFIMPTKEVALGYGVGVDTIRRHKLEHQAELIEGKHFISGVSIPHAASHGSSKGTIWTKRGIVRLGFFIKSSRARLFRDWAEDLIINLEQKQRDLFNEPVAPRQLSARKHNRLSPARLVDLLADVALVESKELRERLVNKLLMKGGSI